MNTPTTRVIGHWRPWRLVQQRRFTTFFVAPALLVWTLSALAGAPPLEGGAFKVTKSTIDNGGGQSTGGDFRLSGSIAQPDATSQTTAGGQFSLTGGFWANGEVVPPGNVLFVDGFEQP